jgi:Lon protease-like protein
MSEALDKVSSVRELPIFPLPVILFPGTPLPLHIFEPRYRQMLQDIELGNKLFGVSYFDASETEATRPEIGHLGCVVELREVQSLPEGRSNILTLGVIRYRLIDYVDTGDPYLVGEVEYFEDYEEDEEQLRPLAKEVLDKFVRIANAIRKINDERGQLPELPETSPQLVSFFIASAVDFDTKIKYEMLESRSTSERLERLQEMLTQAVEQVEQRAQIHTIAKTNGHSKTKINLGDED